jgi:hypothetical protein
MSHARDFSKSTPRSKKREKALANRPMNDKRIKTINDKSVPKKKKTVQDKSETSPPETGGSFKVKAGKSNRARRPTASRKPRETSARKGVTTAKASIPLDAARILEPSDEAIRLRAYFISERRRRFALPGDADSDWLEAKRQLLSEAVRH